MSEIVKLNVKERKILYELDANARQSISQIAKKVRLNKNTVNYIIKSFETQEVILGYYTMIDNSMLGYFSLRIYLKFFNTDEKKEQEIIDWLKDNKIAGVIARTETTYDLVFMVWVKSIYDFDDFWLSFKKKFRKNIWKEKVDVFSKVWHFKRKYLLEDKKPESFEFVGSNKIEKYDELDFSILKLLSKNARMPIIDISEKLKTPPKTIAFRITKLENKNIIQGYRVNINLQKIGYEGYKINMTLNDLSKYNELLDFAKLHHNIIYIDRTLSDLDFEIDVEIENKQELLKLIREIKSNFNVRDSEIFTYQKYYKIESLPQ